MTKLENDSQRAMYWWRKAVNSDDGRACYHLGLMYAEGKGVEQNDAEAERWLKKAVSWDFL